MSKFITNTVYKKVSFMELKISTSEVSDECNYCGVYYYLD